MPLLWLYPILQSIFTCNQLQTNILNYGKTKITKCHCCYHFRNLINDYLLLLWHSEFYFRRNGIYLAIRLKVKETFSFYFLVDRNFKIY